MQDEGSEIACELEVAKIDDGDNEQTLSRDFLIDYQKFVAEFDELVTADSFQGERLEKIAEKFMNIHSDYIKKFPFSAQTNYPSNKTNTNELCQEDLRILGGNKDGKAGTDRICLASDEIADYAKAFGAIYQRACQASYLRATFNKSRHNRDDDRRVPLDFARYAIRFDPSSFAACCWYMIVLGWQLDGAGNPKERTVGSKVFYRAANRCIELNPEHSLPYNLLGRYYYNVAALSWLERTLASNVLGCKLEGTYQQAEQSFRRSHELKDDWLPNGLWMARVLNSQKRPLSEVKEWIDFGLKMQCNEPFTEIERKELLELQSKLKLSN